MTRPLFIAAPIPEAIANELSARTMKIAGVRWVPAENMHITLHFLGEISADVVNDVHAELSTFRFQSFELTTAGVNWFGTPRSVRLLFSEVEPHAQIVDLHRRTTGLLKKCGLEIERRKFRPHITLARMKAVTPERFAHYLEAHAIMRLGPILIDRLILFESYRNSTGSVYKALATYPAGP